MTEILHRVMEGAMLILVIGIFLPLSVRSEVRVLQTVLLPSISFVL